MKRYLIIVFITIFITTQLISQKTKNVFMIVIDGARYSETFGDSIHQHIPVIWNELKPQGTIYTNFFNEGETKTNPGHSTILTGTYQKIINTGGERPDKPTIFEYYRKQKKIKRSKAFVILGKDKLNILTYSTHPEYGKKYRAALRKSNFPEDDIKTYKNIKYVMKKFKPNLIISNFAGVDHAAHDNNWEAYIQKLRIADSLTGVLWNHIQKDPYYRDKTTLIITNDHGRHLDDVKEGFSSHGDSCLGCRHIKLLILGPDTPQGKVDTTYRQMVDIAPTIGKLLKFSTPYSDGKIIESAVELEDIATKP